MSYVCSTCGQSHDDLPLSYAADQPFDTAAIPEEDWPARVQLGEEQCIVDNSYYFLRANIELPILGSSDVFRWGVWVSLSQASYDRAVQIWNQPGRETEPPSFGWLRTQIPVYPDTLNLKTRVHTQPLGIRPLIELEPTDHPLAVEQRQGITCERIQEVATMVQ